MNEAMMQPPASPIAPKLTAFQETHMSNEDYMKMRGIATFTAHRSLPLPPVFERISLASTKSKIALLLFLSIGSVWAWQSFAPDLQGKNIRVAKNGALFENSEDLSQAELDKLAVELTEIPFESH